MLENTERSVPLCTTTVVYGISRRTAKRARLPVSFRGDLRVLNFQRELVQEKVRVGAVGAFFTSLVDSCIKPRLVVDVDHPPGRGGRNGQSGKREERGKRMGPKSIVRFGRFIASERRHELPSQIRSRR